jgi:hypothetical protein
MDLANEFSKIAASDTRDWPSIAAVLKRRLYRLCANLFRVE